MPEPSRRDHRDTIDDLRALLDSARSRLAELLATQWLQDGALLWCDKLVTAPDVIDDQGEVSAQLVRAACGRLLQVHPAMARREAFVSVGMSGFGRLIDWVRQGDDLGERERRAAVARSAVNEALRRNDGRSFNGAARAVLRRLQSGDPR